jgi:farnesyl diphosphate synthase
MSASTFDAARWQARRLDEFEWALDQALSLQAPEALLAPMRYAALDGGKRMRPLLLMAAAEAVAGLDTERMDVTARQAVLQAACAVECVHVYSLMHDDLPCMDDDAMRRGRPTTHIQHGEAMAMLAGDALQTLAFELLSAPQTGVLPAVQVAWVRTLSQASGASGMCGGQAIDLSAVGQSLDQAALEAMHAAKTGALLRAAVVMGGQALGASVAATQALDAFGRDLGLAFQVIDDVLDATADSATLGKTAGKDAAQDKPTFVSLMGVDAARAYAQGLVQRALDAVAAAELTPTHALQSLAQRVVQRAY